MRHHKPVASEMHPAYSFNMCTSIFLYRLSVYVSGMQGTKGSIGEFKGEQGMTGDKGNYGDKGNMGPKGMNFEFFPHKLQKQKWGYFNTRYFRDKSL